MRAKRLYLRPSYLIGLDWNYTQGKTKLSPKSEKFRGGWPGFEVFVWRRCWILSAISPEIQELSHKSRSRINNLYLLTRPIGHRNNCKKDPCIFVACTSLSARRKHAHCHVLRMWTGVVYKTVNICMALGYVVWIQRGEIKFQEVVIVNRIAAISYYSEHLNEKYSNHLRLDIYKEEEKLTVVSTQYMMTGEME